MATKESTVVPSSHSYANVVLNPNDPQIQKQQLTKGINENKENISAEKTKNVKTQQEVPKEEQQQQPQAQQHQQPEIVDEVGFIPVISSNKKDKKTRQNEQEIRREQRGAGKSSGKSSDRPDKPRRNRRERKEQKDKAAAGGATIVEAKEKDKADDDSSANADSSDGQNDKIKFVEAPLPKVNAWNVSRQTIIYYHNIRCKCILCIYLGEHFSCHSSIII